MLFDSHQIDRGRPVAELPLTAKGACEMCHHNMDYLELYDGPDGIRYICGFCQASRHRSLVAFVSYVGNTIMAKLDLLVKKRKRVAPSAPATFVIGHITPGGFRLVKVQGRPMVCMEADQLKIFDMMPETASMYRISDDGLAIERLALPADKSAIEPPRLHQLVEHERAEITSVINERIKKDSEPTSD